VEVSGTFLHIIFTMERHSGVRAKKPGLSLGQFNNENVGAEPAEGDECRIIPVVIEKD
jgi:hypothetical protein